MQRNERLEILIVTEDWFARSLFRTAAEESGLFGSIRTAEDGYMALAETWESVEECKGPDVVLVYGELTGMSGADLARRLREDEETKKVFIALCGTAGEPPPCTVDADFSSCCDAATEDLGDLMRSIGTRIVRSGHWLTG